ncbi:RNA 2',3'-cyclic phosphodiesterase [Sphingomonas sp. 1P06PA]|uniref:RNA 2',3'-cyclic phosphodiesterase n=1 Tax=Sphingomonas sp. 1P06PA TaxID=554121 RepID=UPI0039A5B2CB
MHRLFVALRPPASLRALLIAAMGGVPGARWQDDGQLHCTLRYIGEVDSRTGDDIAQALARVRHPPVELRIEGAGTFDRKGRIDTLWAGVAPREPLAALHAKIDRALIAAGVAPEGRSYLPHITLARFGRGAAPVHPPLEMLAGLGSPPFRVDHFLLYESHLGHDGAWYEPVTRYALA